MAFKFDAARIDGLPAPRPFAEIWLHAPDVEGVHLRFGKVARGGLRWSDRPEDFRTEILGLVKAQQVKNAVIVPVGAKGGFVARRIAAGADRAAAGIAAYERYVGTLIDLTDNIVEDAVVPPSQSARFATALEAQGVEVEYHLYDRGEHGLSTATQVANADRAELPEGPGSWLPRSAAWLRETWGR